MRIISVVVCLSLLVGFLQGCSQRPAEEIIVGTWSSSQDKIRLANDGSFMLYKLKGRTYNIKGKWWLETYEGAMRIFATSNGKNFAVPIKALSETELTILGMPGVLSKSIYTLSRVSVD